MEYIYSAMVLHSAGKEINEANIKKVLTAAGVKPDDTRIKALTAALEGVDIEEALSTSAIPAAPVVAAPAPEGKEEEKEEKKKEKEKKEVSEEEAAAGLGALFG